MKVVVIGSGGREHALAWKLAQSPKIQTIYVAPGNGGTASDPRLKNVPITDFAALADFVQTEKVVLTVVGPEAPLAAGIVDFFRARGLRIFGPTRAAAQLESSKAFAKDFMLRHRIPTAAYATFTDAAAAHAYVDTHGAPIVIKADGLAAGKGVVVATDLAQAHEAIEWMLSTDAEANKLCVMARMWFLWPPAKTTNACKMLTRAPIPVAWEPTHLRQWSRPMCMPASCMKSFCPPSLAWLKTASTTPAFSTPA